MPSGGRGVSIEMKQRQHVKTMMFSDEGLGEVLFEGNLGQLVDLSMVDDRVMEMRGLNGTLRVDLTLEELEAMASKTHSSRASGSKLGSVISSNKKKV